MLLGLAAIGISGWEASAGASAALREATYDRLTAIRETRARQLQRYFEDIRSHVFALSTDESTLVALEEFRESWEQLPATAPGSPHLTVLRDYYNREFSSPPEAARWFPQNPLTHTLQYFYLAANPHPPSSKDLLVAASGARAYSRVHERFHPTLSRYRSAFGFYDIFVISAQGNILYTVRKEVDLGMSLTAEPYQTTTLADAYRRTMKLDQPGEAVIEDYATYPASNFAPAAFFAAPIHRAGLPVGVLAIQVSIEQVNRVMNGDRSWREEGLGETGQAYVVGADNTLRSDVRLEIERPNEYYTQLQMAGVSADIIERVRRNGTSVLTLPVNLAVMERVREGLRGTEIGADFRGVPVLRSHAPLNVPGLNWAIIAEIEVGEALAPVAALRTRILVIGLTVAAVFFLAAGLLARSVTRPVMALVATARRLGQGELGVRVDVDSNDEIGELASAFNRMSEDLARTTVSKEKLEILAGRLIHAQEEERSRIARELHDDLTQRLAALAIEAGRLQRLEASQEEQWRIGIERLKQQVIRLSEDVHGLSRRLHPALLEDLGLVAAIEAECRGFLDREGPPTEFRAEGSFDDLPPEWKLTIYRIVQEGLRNIQRHSDAQQVEIKLVRCSAAVELTITDNGVGFDRNQPGWRAGLGIASMEERTRLVGGSFRLESRLGAGASIHVRLPEQNNRAQTKNSSS